MPTSPSVATTLPGGILAPRYRRSLIAISRAPTLTKIRFTIIRKIIRTTKAPKSKNNADVVSKFSMACLFQSTQEAVDMVRDCLKIQVRDLQSRGYVSE